MVADGPWDLLEVRRAKALGVHLLCGGYGAEEQEQAGVHCSFDFVLRVFPYRDVRMARPAAIKTHFVG
jgi:hypothetical protein